MWMPTNAIAVGRVAYERTTLQGEHAISIHVMGRVLSLDLR